MPDPTFVDNGEVGPSQWHYGRSARGIGLRAMYTDPEEEATVALEVNRALRTEEPDWDPVNAGEPGFKGYVRFQFKVRDVKDEMRRNRVMAPRSRLALAFRSRLRPASLRGVLEVRPAACSSEAGRDVGEADRLRRRPHAAEAGRNVGEVTRPGHRAGGVEVGRS